MSPRGKPDPHLRERLLAAADQLARRDGAGVLTVRRVAREVGVADGALYNHFAGKTELLLALSARHLDSAQHRLDETLEGLPSDGGLEHLLQVSITTCTTAFSDILPLAMLAADGTPGRTTHQIAEHLIGARLVDIVAAHLARSSQLEPIEANLSMARIVVGAARQLALELTLIPNSRDAEEPARLAALLVRRLPSAGSG